MKLRPALCHAWTAARTALSWRAHRSSRARRWLRRSAELALALGALVGLGLLAPVMAQTVAPAAGQGEVTVDPQLPQRLQQLRQDTTRTLQAEWPASRAELEVGVLDARLKLAACQRIEPYLPAGSRLWGRSRIGLRCTEGPVRWNVYLPVVVRVWSKSLVAAHALPAGSVLTAQDLRESEIDLAATPSPAVREAAVAVGRTLQRPLAAGDALRQADLKAKQWFAAGDTVTVTAVGPGYAVRGEGQALSPGLDGGVVRVRTENGRVVSGRAVAERQVEVVL